MTAVALLASSASAAAVKTAHVEAELVAAKTALVPGEPITVALRLVLEPMYRGVLPGIDLGVPIGLGWAPKGSRPLAMTNPNMWVADGGGDFTIGMNGSWRDSLRFSLGFTHFFGEVATFNDAATNAFTWKQALRDRDFVAASLRYSF